MFRRFAALVTQGAHAKPLRRAPRWVRGTVDHEANVHVTTDTNAPDPALGSIGSKAQCRSSDGETAMSRTSQHRKGAPASQRTKASKNLDAPIPYAIVASAPADNIRTLADLGITPARAWALHKLGFELDGESYGRILDRQRDLLAGVAKGIVRVLHQSFGLLVFYVADRLPEPFDPNDVLTGCVVAVAHTSGDRPDWRNIGYTCGDERRFIDVVEVNGEDAPTLVDPLAEVAADALQMALKMAVA